MNKIEIYYIGNWELLLKVCTEKSQFVRVMENLGKLPVFCYDKKMGGYITSVHHLKRLYDICRDRNYKVAVTEQVDQIFELYNQRSEAIKLQKNNDQFKSDLWTENIDCQMSKDQAKAVNVSYRARRYMVGDDLGCGKTPEGLGILCRAFEEGHELALLVVLSGLKYQWKSEILKFTKFKDEDISVVDPYVTGFKCPLGITDKLDLRSKYSPCKRCDRKDKCYKEKNDSNHKWKIQASRGKIVIVNYESVDKVSKYLLKRGLSILILDEASKCKNYRTGIAKNLIKLSKDMPEDSFVIPMSGSFIENGIIELYVPFTLIDPTILGKFADFKKTYLICDYWGNIIGYRNEKKLKALIDKFIIRRTIDEVWKDRPPLIEINKECPMTPKQKVIYDEMVKGTLKQLDDLEKQEKINMASVAPLLNYLIQCCDTTEALDPLTKESGKLELMKELLMDEIPKKEKILIFSFFGNKVIPIIKRELKILKLGNVRIITGKTKPKDREAIKLEFKDDPKIKFLICSDSMSYGINMQFARYVFNFDLPWNPKRIDQRIARVYRRGQTKKVIVYNFVTPNSIEDKILEKISFKRKIFDYFLGSAKNSSIKKRMGVADIVSLLRSK